MTSLLFTPAKLRDLELSNRVVVSPMCQYAATDGSASDWHIMHLGQYAVSGPGLVITEATAVEPEGRISPQCLGLYSDENERALKRVVEFFRAYGEGVKFGVQLAHAGRKGSVPPSFIIRSAVKPEEGGWIPPSPSNYVDSVHTPPCVMDHGHIARVREAWKQAAIRSERIGADMIELHFGHGYLVNQFLSPLINARTDEYGGSFERRIRLALEIYEDCRAVWPAHKPMGVRLSAIDWVEDGWRIEDSVALSKLLKARGCDYICLSSGGVSDKQKIVSGPGYQVPFSEQVRRQAAIATMAVGQIWEPRQAEEVLQQGKADFVALARRMLYDPRWAWRAAHELGDFLAYPPRYKSCHPAMGTALKFPETKEQTEALQNIGKLESDARLKQRID